MPGDGLDPLLSTPGRRASDRILPVRRQKARIVDKVVQNRVTLIFADTGSGKSSQVPQMLLEEDLGPILCTQPRRLAVVSVAKRVAEEIGCTLGAEVGYQIGQRNLSTARTKIVFKTAGVLFEELRTNGAKALSRFKVVILDEVHERSVESDLVLTCMKQLLRTTNAKLVLMSATADLMKYTDYFNELVREEGVEKIAIPSFSKKIQDFVLNTEVVYLEQVVKLLGSSPPHAAVLDAMNESFEPADKGTDIGNSIQNLILDLIFHLHRSEPDFSKNVLVFLPTYRALEKQWLLLRASREPFQVFVLHSSIDMDHSIRAMEACPLHQRKVILATNVAESSITIPGVSFVIDACRSLELYWDCNLKKHQPRIVWVSESQATQRKGRTGRTCNGVVYRLVPRNHFKKFEKFETPAMQLLSLRKQVLMIICASSKALNDPAGLLRKCMNPPTSETVQDALEALDDMDAIQGYGKGKCQPTLYGRLLVSLPLSLEAAMLVVRGGQLGFVQESAILGAILDSTPNPILRPFGDKDQYEFNLMSYYRSVDNEDGQGYVSHPAVMLANLHAFEFWQLFFKNKQRVDALLQQARSLQVQSEIPHKYSSEDDEAELDWCTNHRLSLSSLHSVSETVDSILEALHRFRPGFMNKISGPPSYATSIAGNNLHTCAARQLCDLPDRTSDSWNGSSFQESGKECADEWNGYNHQFDNPATSADTTHAWNDWSFQDIGKHGDVPNGNQDIIAGYNGEGHGQPSTSRHGNGQYLENTDGVGWGISNDSNHYNEVDGWGISNDSISTHVPNWQAGVSDRGNQHAGHTGQYLEATHGDGHGQPSTRRQDNRHYLENSEGDNWGISNSTNRYHEGDGWGISNDSICPPAPDWQSGVIDPGNGQHAGSGQYLEDVEGNGRDNANGYSLENDSCCAAVPYSQSGDFHTLDVEKVLLALVLEIQRGNQLTLVADLGQETLGEQLSTNAPLCSYYLKGMCRKGASCSYSHSASAKPVPCRFFMSPSGCRYGDACRYLHEGSERYTLPRDTTPVNFDEPVATAGSMLDLLPVLNEKEVILLFGEGDFSFAESLSNFLNPKSILATSLDKEDLLSENLTLNERIKKLRRLQMPILWNVDVTSLLMGSAKDRRTVNERLAMSIPWSDVKCVLWNFPFADIEEDLTEHQELMLKFFVSVGIIMISSGLESIPVIITLCNDQYCRWQVEKAARKSFFFLKTSVPFDVSKFGGYHPIRNNLQSTFPVERPLIYAFELFLPSNGLGEDLRKEIRESFRERI